jgi:hypothetical protein
VNSRSGCSRLNKRNQGDNKLAHTYIHSHTNFHSVATATNLLLIKNHISIAILTQVQLKGLTLHCGVDTLLSDLCDGSHVCVRGHRGLGCIVYK